MPSSPATIHVHGELSATAHDRLLDVLLRIAETEKHEEKVDAETPAMSDHVETQK